MGKSGVKPSPLTLHSIDFMRVHVEPALNHGDSPSPAASYNFEGATLGWSFEHGVVPEQRQWWVAVGFATDVEESDRPCPYKIDMQALGVVSVSDAIEPDKQERLAVEYGAALVYGAIREMVTTITARSLLGPLMLPTPSFVGVLDGISPSPPEEDAKSSH